jgi:hypothetical protein
MKNNIPVISSLRSLTLTESGKEPVDLWGLLRGMSRNPFPQISKPSGEDFREGEFITSADIKLLR